MAKGMLVVGILIGVMCAARRAQLLSRGTMAIRRSRKEQTKMSEQISKKDHAKKKPTPDEGHWEGKFWCNCRTRNYRLWLGKKKYGATKDQLKVWKNNKDE